MPRNRFGLASVLIGAILVAACASTPTPTPTPARVECELVVQIHQGRDRVMAATAAARQGQTSAASAAADDARTISNGVMSALAALGPGEGVEKELRTALTWASIDIDQYAQVFAGLEGLNVSATLDAARVAEQNRLIFDQLIGTLDALAIHGRDREPGLCPDLSFGVVLPTLPPAPTAHPPARALRAVSQSRRPRRSPSSASARRPGSSSPRQRRLLGGQPEASTSVA
jgi:hypothetical protein